MNDLPAIYAASPDPLSWADAARTALMYSGLFLLVVLGGAWISLALGGVAARVLARLKAWRLRALALAMAGAVTWYAGGKHAARVDYPRTDPLQAYLTDAGSYVTNDFVHVAFARIIVPDSAPLLIDYRQVGSTNDADWVNHTTTTFAQFAVPCDLPFAAATNYNWAVYTTWTPGPSVQTNGVWHANWGVDRRTGRHAIPIRTAVRLDGETIATPKSKENAHE